jgi:hypothetical protein
MSPTNIHILKETDKTMPFELSEQGASSKTSDFDSAQLLPLTENTSDVSQPSPTPELPGTPKRKHFNLCLVRVENTPRLSIMVQFKKMCVRYESEDGTKFTMAWFLKVLESLANVVFGMAAMVIMGLTGTGHDANESDGGISSRNGVKERQIFRSHHSFPLGSTKFVIKFTYVHVHLFLFGGQYAHPLCYWYSCFSTVPSLL